MCSFFQEREKTKEDFLEKVVFEQGFTPVEIKGQYSGVWTAKRLPGGNWAVSSTALMGLRELS